MKNLMLALVAVFAISATASAAPVLSQDGAVAKTSQVDWKKCYRYCGH